MLQEKSEMEDKVQRETSNSSTDTLKNGIEFSKSLKRPEGSEEDFSDSDRDEQEATQEQPKLLSYSATNKVWLRRWSCLFRISNRNMRAYSYREAIEAADNGKWITAMEQEMEFLDRNQI